MVNIRSEIWNFNEVYEYRRTMISNQLIPQISANTTEINERICKANKTRP